ncbi:MAG: hypothetical protein ACRDA3_06345 [Peptostreptococcaceae bacterium]
MRKDASILFILIILFLLVGVPKHSDSTLLDTSYFNIVNEYIENGNITSASVEAIIKSTMTHSNNKLKKYIYNGELSSFDQSIIYRYSIFNETLKIEYNIDNAKVSKITYESYNDNNNYKLMFNPFDRQIFTINSSFNDLNGLLSLSTLILNSTKDEYKLYDMYCNICNKMNNNESLALKKVVEIAPEVNVTNYNNTHISLKTERECLYIYNDSVLYTISNLSLYNTRSGKNQLDIYNVNIKEQQKTFMLIN